MKILIVGAGFSGAVVARHLAESNKKVTVIDRRDHIGGNAYDYINSEGIRVHKYGPHLFHTSNMAVVEWLSRFTEWTPYKHKVKALLEGGQLVTLPVNAETLEIVGHDNIIDTFYRPYTRKMWGLEIEDIDAEIINRVKIRDDMNEYYFPDDQFQAIPKNGYSDVFNNIFDHPNIDVMLETDIKDISIAEYRHVFNSMAIDEYFNYVHGHLPYRSIKFHTFTLPIPKIYPVATVNFTHNLPFTRVTEWKNLPNTGGSASHTTLTIEEPCDYVDNNLERYYPIKDAGGLNRNVYRKYAAMSPDNMTFMGRCGLYAYLDMHQAISSSLKLANAFVAES